MANIALLHELMMFAKASGRKMTVEDAIKEYYSYYIEDCCHNSTTLELISHENKLRELLSSSALNEDQKTLVLNLLEEIGIAKAEEAAILKDCIGPEYYDDEYYGE